jgi:hypothetical protein
MVSKEPPTVLADWRKWCGFDSDRPAEWKVGSKSRIRAFLFLVKARFVSIVEHM